TKGLIFSTQDAIKGRHYFVGAALGWALDFCGIVHWKSRIEREDISLQSMLENVFFMEEAEKQERVMRVQKTLNWLEMREKIDQQLNKEKKEGEKVLQTFEAQEGIVIHMGLPSGHMSSGGRHQKSYQVDRLKALLEDTSLSTSQDQSWTLQFKSIPLVF